MGNPSMGGLTPAQVSSRTLDHLGTLIAQAPLNLVARGERDALRVRHLDEAIAIGQSLNRRLCRGQAWIDLGTGGGLPGLVLALQYPEVEWMLVDAAAKKARAVAGFVEALGLPNVGVRSGRAEDLARLTEHRERYDGVIARAVAPLRVLVELSRGFVGDDGLLVAVKGPGAAGELEAAGAALARCCWTSPQLERVSSTIRPTWLATMRAVGSPPAEIPRRAGVPQRRPL